MKITTKNLSDTKVEIKAILDSDDMSAARKKAVAHLAKEVKIAGFRKGKVPADLAEKHLDPNDLNSTILDMAVRTSIPKVFEEAKQTPLSMPQVNVTKFVPNETVEYTATADILPEVKVGDYRKLKVKKQKAEVADKDIQDIIDNIQTAYAEKKVVKRPAQLGDEVVIDFEGKKDGVAFDGGKAKDYKLVLGSGQFIPGFEDGVVGHESGDRFELNLTFPKDYHNKDLAGAKTTFSVLVKQVNEITKPALDDQLAQKCGPFKTMDDLRADIKKNLAAQNEARLTERYKDDLVNALVEKSTVSAPEVLIQDQLRFIKDDITRNAASQGLQFADYLKQIGQTEEAWTKDATKIAEARVKASLVLQILARDQNITVSDDAVNAKIAELKEVYKNAPDAIKNLKDPRVRQDIKNRLTIEKTLDFLIAANQA